MHSSDALLVACDAAAAVASCARYLSGGYFEFPVCFYGTLQVNLVKSYYYNITMAYTLVEFNDDSLAVVASTAVTAVDGEHRSVDVGEECIVQWRERGRKSATKHAAKVLKRGGMFLR